jgi:hypothetical protein
MAQSFARVIGRHLLKERKNFLHICIKFNQILPIFGHFKKSSMAVIAFVAQYLTTSIIHLIG